VSKDAPQTDQGRKSVRQNRQQGSQNRQQGPKNGLSVWLKILLSLLFVFHLLGVFIAPLNSSIEMARAIHGSPFEQTPQPQAGEIRQVAYDESEIVYFAQGTFEPRVAQEVLAVPETSSVAVDSTEAESRDQSLSLYEFYIPYLNLLYLNHGYGFFSPDPNPSHLIRFRLVPKTGEEFEGIFPNLTPYNHPALEKGSEPEVHWPRLRYHRHFMLAEQLIEGVPDTNEDPNERKPLIFSGKTYAAHLFRIHDAKQVRLDYIEHRLLTQEEIRDGKKTDDPATYEVMFSLTYPDDFSDVTKSLEETAP